MKVGDLLNKIANGELEDETMISCNGFFHNIIYKNENLYWVHKNEIVETKYIIEAMKNDYEFKIYNEVEIIEEDKKIEKLEYIENGEFVEVPSNVILMNKINEIIDYLEENK